VEAGIEGQDHRIKDNNPNKNKSRND